MPQRRAIITVYPSSEPITWRKMMLLSCVIFSLSVRGYCSRSRIRSQPSGTRTVNMNWGMSHRSSEVRTKHALAGMKGHSHLVIWVNYKCCRPQGEKMSWTAVSADTHTHTHSGSLPVSMVCSLHCIQVDMVKKKKKSSLLWQPKSSYSHFIFLVNLSRKSEIKYVRRAHQQLFKVPVGFLLAINHTKLLRDVKNQFENRLMATFKAWIS